jgi:hypothetical protein
VLADAGVRDPHGARPNLEQTFRAGQCPEPAQAASG